MRLRYNSRTFAVKYEGLWVGLTYAFITHSKYERRPFDQRMTPYTEEGRNIYRAYQKRNRPPPQERPSINTPEDMYIACFSKGRRRKYNFEYYMNREYAYNRDRGKCKCCGIELSPEIPKHCHHIQNTLHIDSINKVSNLAWLCAVCHEMVHTGTVFPGVTAKTAEKIDKYREKLRM